MDRLRGQAQPVISQRPSLGQIMYNKPSVRPNAEAGIMCEPVSTGPQATILVVSRLGGFPADLSCGVAASKWGFCRSQRRQVGGHRVPCFGGCLNLLRDGRRSAWMLASLWGRWAGVKLPMRGDRRQRARLCLGSGCPACERRHIGCHLPSHPCVSPFARVALTGRSSLAAICHPQGTAYGSR